MDADGDSCVGVRAQKQQTSLASENSLQQKQRLNVRQIPHKDPPERGSTSISPSIESNGSFIFQN